MKKVFIVFLTSFLLWGVLGLFIANYSVTQMWKSLKQMRISSEKESIDMSDFWEVYDIIKDDFYGSDIVNKEDIVHGAIKGMVESLWDKHSEFMSPEITEKFEASLSWDFEWIWAVVEKVPLWVKIERIIKWSPAKKYGVRNGDIVIKANEVNLEDLDIYDAIDNIKWPAWTSVRLEIIRPWEEKIIKITVVRAKIKIPSVELKILNEDKIAYIAINMFGENTAEEFKKSLNEVKNSKVQGLIIDMRDNGGWYLQSAVNILSEFVEKWKILVKTNYTDSIFNQNYYSLNEWEIFDKKIVILVNENSASASEITAGALRDYDKAIVVGKQTYGKGSVQQPFSMDDGSLLKLTVAHWFTPKGATIEWKGIQPDIEVDFKKEDYSNKYDRQLEEAKNLLKIYIEKQSIWLTIEAYKKISQE